jgi:hypothetical protein
LKRENLLTLHQQLQSLCTLRNLLFLPEGKLKFNMLKRGGQNQVMSPKPQKVVSRDARYTNGERKTSTPGEQSSERLQAIPQSRPLAAEGACGATGEKIQFPDILDTTKKSRGTFEETQDAGLTPTLPTARPLGAQAAPESKTPTADHQRKDVSTQLKSDAFPQPKLPAADRRGLGSLSQKERDVKDRHTTLRMYRTTSYIMTILSFTLPEAQSLDTQDAQRTNRESTTPTADEWKESEFKTPRVQPTDSQDNIREEKTLYLQEEAFSGTTQPRPSSNHANW